jgi:hypothetical protein
VAEAKSLLPHRTVFAIQTARQSVNAGKPRRPWTKAEDRKLLKYPHESVSAVSRRFKDRTDFAVKKRRYLLSGFRSPPVPWKTTELTKLKSLWPNTKRGEIEQAFPNRSWSALKSVAQQEGWRRIREMTTSPSDLREAVRRRAREDGVSLAGLGAEIGCGSYFLGYNKVDDLPKIGRAVEFFGGRLLIDWQDE